LKTMGEYELNKTDVMRETPSNISYLRMLGVVCLGEGKALKEKKYREEGGGNLGKAMSREGA